MPLGRHYLLLNQTQSLLPEIDVARMGFACLQAWQICYTYAAVSVLHQPAMKHAMGRLLQPDDQAVCC